MEEASEFYLQIAKKTVFYAVSPFNKEYLKYRLIMLASENEEIGFAVVSRDWINKRELHTKV